MAELVSHTLDRIRTIIWTIGIAGAFLCVVPFFYIIGQAFEAKHFPVTTNVRVQLVSSANGVMKFHAWGDKERACDLVDLKILVDIKGNGNWTKGAVFVVDENGTGPVARPLGDQDLGYWGVVPVANAVRLQGTYHCHFLWNTPTNLGAWDLDDKPLTPLAK